MSSGIYQIENQVNGKRYVGSAMNLRKRWRAHLRDLRRGQHWNQHLQRAFDKYGEPAFAFSILEHIEDTLQLIQREQHFLDMLHPGYNLCPRAGSTLGYRHTKESREKCSESKRGRLNPNYGKSPSMATRRKQSKVMTGRHYSREHCENISVSKCGERNPNYGKSPSAETRLKSSEAHKGERNAMYGKHHSEAARKKMSEAQSGERNYGYGKHLSKAHRKKISQAHKGMRHTEASKRKMSEARKAWWHRARAATNGMEDK